MLVSEVIARLQELEPDAEVEAYIIPVPLFQKVEGEMSSLEQKDSRCEVKQGYCRDWLKGDKFIKYRMHGFRPRCVLISDDDFHMIEDYSSRLHTTFDEGLRRLLSFSLKALWKLDRKEWKNLDWFR